MTSITMSSMRNNNAEPTCGSGDDGPSSTSAALSRAFQNHFLRSRHHRGPLLTVAMDTHTPLPRVLLFFGPITLFPSREAVSSDAGPLFSPHPHTGIVIGWLQNWLPGGQQQQMSPEAETEIDGRNGHQPERP